MFVCNKHSLRYFNLLLKTPELLDDFENLGKLYLLPVHHWDM